MFGHKGKVMWLLNTSFVFKFIISCTFQYKQTQTTIYMYLNDLLFVSYFMVQCFIEDISNLLMNIHGNL